MAAASLGGVLFVQGHRTPRVNTRMFTNDVQGVHRRGLKQKTRRTGEREAAALKVGGGGAAAARKLLPLSPPPPTKSNLVA